MVEVGSHPQMYQFGVMHAHTFFFSILKQYNGGNLMFCTLVRGGLEALHFGDPQ